MASEISVSLALVARKGGTVVGLDLGKIAVTWTGNNALHNRQTVGTTEEALVLGDCGAGGLLIAVNRDGTNYIRIRGAAGETPLVRARAGEPVFLRVDAGAVPTVQANVANCELEYVLLED